MKYEINFASDVVDFTFYYQIDFELVLADISNKLIQVTKSVKLR